MVKRIVPVLIALVLAFPTLRGAAQDDGSPYRVVGFYTYYSLYDDYFITDIPASQLTHLVYAYINISDNGQCIFTDRWADAEYLYPGDKPGERLRGNFKQLQLLKKRYPELQILMSVGGWEHSAKFSDVALTRDSRIRFGNSCIAFMRQYGFDGIDIDWRFPVNGGLVDGRPEDSENLPLLMSELRGQLEYWSQRDTRPYLLTMTVPAVKMLYSQFPLLQLVEYTDWFNVMTYGFQGEWSEIASHHAPLFKNSRDPRGEEVQTRYNVDGAVSGYLTAGVPAEKIVVGLPFYAQTWRNVLPNDRFGLYSPAGGVPDGTRPGGILYFRDLAPLLSNPAYVRFFDDETKSPWLYDEIERVAISYEDPESIAFKITYVREKRLGGVMIWELSDDDDSHTLLNAITAAFGNE